MTIPRLWIGGVQLVLAWLVMTALPLLEHLGRALSLEDIAMRLALWWCLVTAMVYVLAWKVAGRERVSLDAESLEHRVELFGMRKVRRYSLRTIRNPRVWHGPYPTDSRARRALGGSGLVWFDYAGKPKHLGVGLDGPRARALVAELERRMAQADGRGPYS